MVALITDTPMFGDVSMIFEIRRGYTVAFNVLIFPPRIVQNDHRISILLRLPGVLVEIIFIGRCLDHFGFQLFLRVSVVMGSCLPGCGQTRTHKTLQPETDWLQVFGHIVFAVR
jgi:hypothetical protein